MALKPVVHEYCPLCGKLNAIVRGAVVWHGGHNCPHAPQGPKSPPRDNLLRDVVFIAGVKVEPGPAPNGKLTGGASAELESTK